MPRPDNCGCGNLLPQSHTTPRRYCPACRIKANRVTKSRWRIQNRELVNSLARAWASRNKARRSLKMRNWRKNSINRLVSNVRSRIGHALKRNSKSARTFSLLGCSLPELWRHLESKFVPGMTRENYGPVWHVDHIRPVILFDLSDPEQQKECFHYSNLQPLFALDNLRKGAKILI